MHSPEKQTTFVLLRANGWSLGKISDKLDVPKSTVFHWDCERRGEIHTLKCMQVEKLQEKFVPSYEEELVHLSSYLARVEQALQKQTFEHMRPEFLLQTALHLRGRLTKLRTDLPLNGPIQQAGLEPIPVGGCISRAERPVLAADYETEPLSAPAFRSEDAASSPSVRESTPINLEHSRPQNVAPSLEDRAGESRASFEPGRSEELCLTASAPERVNDHLSDSISDRKSDSQNGTFRHENGVGSKLDALASASCDTQNGTTVPFSEHQDG